MARHGPAPHPHETPHHPHWPLGALLFGFVLCLGLFSVHESSTWLRVRTGARIAAEAGLPAEAADSYTLAGRLATTDAWLCDLLFYGLDRRFGPRGVVAAKAAAGAAAFAMLLPLSLSNPIVAAGVLAFGALGAWPQFTETPAPFDWLMLALVIRVLRPRRRLSRGVIAQAALLELLWVNLHATGAALGLWLVALKVFKGALKADRRERLGCAALAGLCLAAFLANPHGLEVLPRLFGSAETAATAWPAPSVFGVYGVLAALGAAAVWTCLQQEFFLSMAAAGLLALSLLIPALRGHYLLAACPVVTLAIGHFRHALSDTLARVARLGLLLGLALAGHLYWVSLPLSASRGYGTAALDGALTYLKASGATGRLFNEPEAGDALIAEGERSVFVDSRGALYGAAFMKDASSWPSRWAALDEIYGFDYAFILNRRGAYPARALDESAAWRLVYADDAALVYVKRSGLSGWLAGGKPRPAIRPNSLWPDVLDPALAQAKRAAQTLSELDSWIVQAPDSVSALLWKAYALDRLKLFEKGERLLHMAAAHPRLRWDPGLLACQGFVLEKRGRSAQARAAYSRAAKLARRRGERALEAAVLFRLAPLARLAGREWEAKGLEERVKELLSEPPEEA